MTTREPTYSRADRLEQLLDKPARTFGSRSSHTRDLVTALELPKESKGYVSRAIAGLRLHHSRDIGPNASLKVILDHSQGMHDLDIKSIPGVGEATRPVVRVLIDSSKNH